jgi:NAD(P)-dependent dehydrogenase (short-subunit alcohol dehydrogenase family)
LLPLRGRILRPIRERHQVLALKRYAKPDDIAAAVVFLASTNAGHTAGHVLSVDGGFAAAGVLFHPSDER